MIKGFSIIKCGLSMCFMIIFIYNIAMLAFLMGADNQSPWSALIRFFMAGSALAAFVMFDGFFNIKNFYYGFNRYNIVHTIEEADPGRKRRNQAQQIGEQQREKSNRASFPNKNFIHKEHVNGFDLIQITKLARSSEDNNSYQSLTHKGSHSFRLEKGSISHKGSFSIPIEDLDFSAIDNIEEQKKEWRKKTKKVYASSLHHYGLTQEVDEKRIMKSKLLLGQKIKRIIEKHKKNIQQISSLAGKVYGVQIVESSTQIKQSRNDQFSKANSSKMKENNKVTLDEIMESFLNKNGKKREKWTILLNRQVASKFQMDALALQIQERQRLDEQIFYGVGFRNANQRNFYLDRLEKTANRMAAGQKIFGYDDNISNQFSLQKHLAWVVVQYVNSLTGEKIPEALVYMKQGPPREEVKQMYKVELLKSDFDSIYFLVHENYLTKKQEKFYCKPGEDNIASLFVGILTLIKQRHSDRLAAVPELNQIVERIVSD